MDNVILSLLLVLNSKTRYLYKGEQNDVRSTKIGIHRKELQLTSLVKCF